jgi:hypothetical protein
LVAEVEVPELHHSQGYLGDRVVEVEVVEIQDRIRVDQELPDRVMLVAAGKLEDHTMAVVVAEPEQQEPVVVLAQAVLG